MLSLLGAPFLPQLNSSLTPGFSLWNPTKQEDSQLHCVTGGQLSPSPQALMRFLFVCLFLTMGSGPAPLSRLLYLWFLIRAVSSMAHTGSQCTRTSCGPLTALHLGVETPLLCPSLRGRYPIHTLSEPALPANQTLSPLLWYPFIWLFP